jgi:hypothetical protein
MACRRCCKKLRESKQDKVNCRFTRIFTLAPLFRSNIETSQFVSIPKCSDHEKATGSPIIVLSDFRFVP